MRAAYLLSPSFITQGRMGASKAALILMKNSHFDSTLQQQIKLHLKSHFLSHFRVKQSSKQASDLKKCHSNNQTGSLELRTANATMMWSVPGIVSLLAICLIASPASQGQTLTEIDVFLQAIRDPDLIEKSHLKLYPAIQSNTMLQYLTIPT